MAKFKIEKQQKLYGEYEISPKVNELEIECDYHKFNNNETLVTKDNLTEINQKTGKNYNVGDTHIWCLNSVSFFLNKEEIENINVFGDPYYKLFEQQDGEWIQIDKHSCR
jgi:hypothetical protein